MAIEQDPYTSDIQTLQTAPSCNINVVHSLQHLQEKTRICACVYICHGEPEMSLSYSVSRREILSPNPLYALPFV